MSDKPKKDIPALVCEVTEKACKLIDLTMQSRDKLPLNVSVAMMPLYEAVNALREHPDFQKWQKRCEAEREVPRGPIQ